VKALGVGGCGTRSVLEKRRKCISKLILARVYILVCRTDSSVDCNERR
jgi:hypothetical protein